MVDLIKPDWPAPSHVKAYATTRNGGYSLAPFDTFNLANHVGDKPEDVTTNRALLREAIDLPTEPLWLEQQHGTKLICADAPPDSRAADGSFAKTANKVCVVLTADCLPILLTNTVGSFVAALHAGWRGLAGGLIEQGVKVCKRNDTELMAWLGPAISQDAYEVGTEMRDAFVQADPQAEQAFKPSTAGKWLADLYLLAKQRLEALDVKAIYGGNFCTCTESKRFFSYRRDGKTGRMATLVWLTPFH